MTAGEYCNREIIITEQTISVAEAAALMRRHHVGDLVIVEKHHDKTLPVGIITDRDIVIEVVAQRIDPESLTVRDVMSDDPVSVTEQHSLLDTLEVMREQSVRRLLVVDQGGNLQGMLTADDAIELIAEQMSDLTRLIHKELDREQELHP